MPFLFHLSPALGTFSSTFLCIDEKKDFYLTLISFLIIFFKSKVLISNPYPHRSICLFIPIKNVFL